MEQTHLLPLPVEMIVHLGQFLDLKSLLACSSTCHYLRDVLNNNNLWKRHYRRDVIDFVRGESCLVSPEFRYIEGDSQNLGQLCDERVNLLRQNHLLKNWRAGRYVNHQVFTSGNQMVFQQTLQTSLANNDRQIIYDHVYLFIYVLGTSEITIWNIRDVPFLYTRIAFSKYRNSIEPLFPVREEQKRILYQIVKNKLLVIQGNLVQVFKINLSDNDITLEWLISIDKDKIVDDFGYSRYKDCYNCIVGGRLISKLCCRPEVHIRDILTGVKLKCLRAPVTGWALYAFSSDDEDNIVFSSRADRPLSTVPLDFSSIVSHVSNYSVSKDEFTTLFPELKASRVVHAMHSGSYIVLFCENDVYGFRCTIFVYNLSTSCVIAKRTFCDLGGLREIQKSRMIGGRLIIATKSSVDTLEITSLKRIKTIPIQGRMDIDFFPVFSNTFVILSSSKIDLEVWDVDKQEAIIKLLPQSYFYLNQSCSKVVFISSNGIVVRHYWC